MPTCNRLQETDNLLDLADREFYLENALRAVELLREAVEETLADIASEKGWPRASDDDLYEVAERLDEKDESGLGFMLSGYSATQHFPAKVSFGFFDMSIGDADDAQYIARSHIKLARKLAGRDACIESGHDEILTSKELWKTENLISAADMEFSNGNVMKAMETLRDAAWNTLCDIARHKGWPSNDDNDLYKVAERLANKDDSKDFILSGYSTIQGFPSKVSFGFFDMANGDDAEARYIARCFINRAQQLAN